MTKSKGPLAREGLSVVMPAYSEQAGNPVKEPGNETKGASGNASDTAYHRLFAFATPRLPSTTIPKPTEMM